MDNEIGEAFRHAFLELLAAMGTELDVNGERRRALKQSQKKDGFVVFQFADEFAVEAGDRIRESVIETHYDVVDSEPISRAGSFTYFEVTTERAS